MPRLKARGALVERHDDHFAQDTLDSSWLPAVGKRGWVVISKDKRIRHREVERQAVRAAGVALFVFRGGNMTGDEIASTISAALREMIALVETQPRPFIAAISKAGKVKLLDVL